MMHQPITIPRRWFILRMAASRTLAVATSLCNAGITAWTPAMTINRRRPRCKAATEVEVPILPSFVFVAEADLGAVCAALTMPINPHPQFSIFRHAGRIALLTEHQIASLGDEELRLAEVRDAARERARRAALKASKRTLPAIGSEVRVSATAFTGLVGKVEGAKSGAAIVNFGSGMSMTIEAWHLEPIVSEVS